MIEIVARKMAGGARHEHIQSVMWREVRTTVSTVTTVADMVEWLDESGRNRAIVGSYPADFVEVGTIHPDRGRPYLRTYANGDWTDNLLSLPTF